MSDQPEAIVTREVISIVVDLPRDVWIKLMFLASIYDVTLNEMVNKAIW